MWIASRYWKASWRFRKSCAPLADRPHDRPEIVVEEDDGRDLARAAGAALAHRDADVGGLQRGHVVDAVAGHRDDLAGLLEAAHERQLLRRRRAGDHVDLAQCRAEPARDARLDVVAGDDRRRPVPEADLARHRPRGQGVVAGHHDRVDARLAGRPERPRPLPRARGPRMRAARRSGSRARPRSRPTSDGSSGLQAHAITRWPAWASSVTRPSHAARSPASRSDMDSMVSAAPLAAASSRPSTSQTTAVSRLRPSVNGNVASTRGRAATPPSGALPSELRCRADRRSRCARRGRPANTRRVSSRSAAGSRWRRSQATFGDRPRLVGADAGDAADVLDGDGAADQRLVLRRGGRPRRRGRT